MKRPIQHDTGFTLLEVLVALVVLGLVITGLGQGLRFGLDATVRQERQSIERGDLDAVDRLLRRLVTQIDPGTERDPALLAGTPAALAFTTDLGAAASALSTSRANVRLAVEASQLVLRWQPAIHAVRLTPPPQPEQAVLLDGIQRIDLAYFGSVGSTPPTWNTTWQERTPPLLIRIRLVFPQPTRHWPDIIAAPATPR